MARSNAVAAVTGELFQDGWSRVRGSMQGLGQKRQQMMRAAKGHRAAVFKAIQSGGTHTRGQLVNQLEYLTTKSSHIVDSRGVLDGKTQLSAEEIRSVADRFTARWDEGFNPKMGHTTHMLMSFPIGTRGTDVRNIASDVCERFFATEGRTFDYLIAVHEDRDHPHAHVVLNRRSQEGEFFFLGRNHDFNYDTFRQAMVEEAEKYGVCLEATRRVDRGVLTYPARTKEIYAAKEEGRAPVERQRIGRDLDRALADIASNAKVYLSLAAEASTENREDISNALFRAGEMLARGGQLLEKGEIYMASEQSFDDLKSTFVSRMGRVEAMVAATPEAQRPQAQAQLHEIYKGVAHLQPIGVRSQSLVDAPSRDGVYSETNINRDALDRLREPETRAQIETALRGTGISSETIINRIETSANNAALEREWLSDDLQKIAAADGLNLERREDLQQAADRLDQLHVQLGTALERAEVLREDGVIEAEAAADLEEYDAYAADLANDPSFMEAMRQQAADADYREQVSEELRTEAGILRMENEGIAARQKDADQEQAALREATIQQGIAAEVARYKAEGHSTASVGQLRPEIEDDVEARVVRAEARGEQLGSWDRLVEADQREELREIEAEAEAQDLAVASPEVVRVVEHERDDKINPPFTDVASVAAFRAEIERELSEDQVQALKSGDADALKPILDDRLDRLYAAKAYLQSDADTANSDAVREVISEIADQEYEGHRLKNVHGETEKGQTHG